jgi:predicted nucleic acid-binding protein
MKITHSHLILDACCVLNFCASGNFLSILKSIPAEIVVAMVVQEHELKTLQKLQDEGNEGANQFEAAIAQGLLKVVDFDSEEEEESFVNYAAILDDGESATFAIAVHRNWAIATDDKKAISFIQKKAPHLQVLSTIEIIKHWSEKEDFDSSKLRDVLNEISTKGRYLPPRNHFLRDWWEAGSSDV